MKRRILYVPPALSTSRTWTVRRMRKAWSVPTSLRRAALKSARYTLALYIDRENHKLVKSLLFDDEKDPYQMNNLSLEENQEVVKDLCAEMGKVLKEIDDPWYKEGILKDMIPY